MKQFVIEVFIFALILFVALLLFKKTVPYYWGNPPIAKKMEHLQKDAEEYDTYFVGSSRTYRHIEPKIFDEIAGTNSFNLGQGGVFYLETHYILDHFLKTRPKDEKLNIFIQKMEPIEIDKLNVHSIRSKYYLDWKRLKMAVKYYWKEKNWQQIYRHSSLFVENKLCIGELRAMNKYRTSKKGQLKDKIKAQKGYYALDQELRLDKNKGLGLLNAGFKKMKSTKYDEVKGKRQRVKIQKMPFDKIGIDIEDRPVQLYKITDLMKLKRQFYFDSGYHYNEKGAKVFTRRLGERFARE